MGPTSDQIEITVLGPGFGECVLIHVGNGHWVIVDSCVDTRTKQNAALKYLRDIGVDPATSVRLIIATHWHDDHVRGISGLVEACRASRFCCSSALTSQEFLRTIIPYEHRKIMSGPSGVTEIFAVMECLSGRKNGGVQRQRVWAGSNRRIMKLDANDTGHGRPCEVWALSPSDKQIDKFHLELTRLMPQIKETKGRATLQRPNQLAVVSWVQIGELALLLGSDLEETSDPETGWSVIVSNTERPGGRASILKVPHHGSSNAHNNDVWANMLVSAPFAVLAPYHLGGSFLPTHSDAKRITERTSEAYCSSRRGPPRAKRRDVAVERAIREMGARLKNIEGVTGRVTLRNGGTADWGSWHVSLSDEACRLSELY